MDGGENRERICRRCLLKEMPDAEFYRNMYAYVENLDEEIRTPAGQYEQRLSLCRECTHLLNGMCRICGCFVEMRAAVLKNYCPAVEKRW